MSMDTLAAGWGDAEHHVVPGEELGGATFSPALGARGLWKGCCKASFEHYFCFSPFFPKIFWLVKTGTDVGLS